MSLILKWATALAGVLLAASVCAAGLDYRWFAADIAVSRLPADAQFVAVSTPIDLSAMVARLGEKGVVDEHSLRLWQVAANGRQTDTPLQFTPDPQPRLKTRQLLPGTPASVSYLGEWRAGVTPAAVKVAGTLSWIANADHHGAARYRLEFGILQSGTVIQVPYPPQDLKVFDGDGRPTPLHDFPRMQVRPARAFRGELQLFDLEHVITTYHLGPAPTDASPDFRRPFFYPVIGPDELPLTGFGKPHDPTGSHNHHYSLWVAHNKVDGVDFWGEHGGIIANDGVELSEDGPVFCTVVQKTRWMKDGRDLLGERRRIVLYHTPDAFRELDVDLEFFPPGKEDVTLGKTTFGFLAARVAPSMSVFDGGGEIVNSKGDRNERGAHLKRADWLDQSGPVAPGKWAGLALLDHPDNPNHPTVWHCRNDGWAGAAFAAEAPYTIKVGTVLRLRYRVLLHRGNATEGAVARRYAEYSARPTVHIGDPAALHTQ